MDTPNRRAESLHALLTCHTSRAPCPRLVRSVSTPASKISPTPCSHRQPGRVHTASRGAFTPSAGAGAHRADVEACLVAVPDTALVNRRHQREHLELVLARGRLFQNRQPQRAPAAGLLARQALLSRLGRAHHVDGPRLEHRELATLYVRVHLRALALAIADALDARDAHVLVRNQVTQDDDEVAAAWSSGDVDAEQHVVARVHADEPRLHLRVAALHPVLEAARVSHQRLQPLLLDAHAHLRLCDLRDERRAERRRP
mmetsp:Transcript_155/g.339  ORF Transcript_155/g.339 Transcript_155/m.339 type:complete len:258 (-) Transcript_155:1279-2052(-)